MEIVYANNEAQAEALNAIIGERAYQDAKWGPVDERHKQVGSWLTLMRKLLRDAEDAWATSSDDILALDEIRKVVTAGVACFEQHGAILREPVFETSVTLPQHKDERLASVSNERLHKAYDAIRDHKDLSVGYDFDVNGKTLTMSRDEIDAELTARGSAPLPF